MTFLRTDIRLAVTFAFALSLSTAFSEASHADEPMIELTLGSQRVEGSPVEWNASVVHLMGRDGRLWEFAPDAAANFKKTSSSFRPYSVSELRAALLRELGEQYDVSGTGHYVIAHPKGQRDRWAERFEDLYKNFWRYVSVRGFKPVEPEFPLIGVVCVNREDFQRVAAAQGMKRTGGILGFYDMLTNRILLYDMDSKGAVDWREKADVLIHEATHQTAFNVGVHNRYAKPPVWVAEGLATSFEARGVYDAHGFPNLSDRVNRGRYDDFRMIVPNHKPEIIQALVASDDVFRKAPPVAYAEAWALTFYLMEKYPKKYAAYLAKTAQRESFSTYAAKERLADFTTVFGDDWKMLEAQMLRFYATMK